MIELSDSTRPKLRLLLVDDHPVVRAGLKSLLSLEPDFDVVGEADNGTAALALAERLEPSLVLMDVSLPDQSGAETTRQLKGKLPEIAVLALSVHEESTFVRMLLDAGAEGYALKRSACDELVRAIHIVAAGGIYVDPAIIGFHSPPQRRSSPPGFRVALLSDREAEVVRHVAQGLTLKEMALRLGVSPRTVETYRARALEKLNLKTRADLVRYALRSGWLKTQ